MGKARPPALVLDASALIAFERGEARMRALVREALRGGTRLIVPAGVVGRVWRDGTRHPALRALLRAPATRVVALDEVLAEAAGVLCGKTGTSNVTAASIVLVARRERAAVVTSDVSSFHDLDATLTTHTI